MTTPNDQPWQPTQFLLYSEGRGTSMDTALIETDAGPAYIKAMGNREGSHALAREFVGTQLARWFGLPTFDFALLQIDDEIDEIPFLKGGRADSGSAFVTRAAPGHPWGGSAEELTAVVNREDFARLVVFDTWTRNVDRHPPEGVRRRPNRDNVFLQKYGEPKSGQFLLVAMDHGHCFTGGRDLTPRLADLANVRDEGLYGLFPEFIPYIAQADIDAAVIRLADVHRDVIGPIVGSVPPEWEVSSAVRAAWVELICQRAAFVADTVAERLARRCWPDQLFDNA